MRRHLFLFALCVLPSWYLLAQDIPYAVGNWDADSLGNHRAIIRVNAKSDVVRAHVPWRRRDLQPELKKIVLVDLATGRQVQNLLRVELNREFGDLIFQPRTAPGTYALYYLPYSGSKRSNYPKIYYPKPDETPDTAWIRRNGLDIAMLSTGAWRALPEASVIEFQSIDDFNSVQPMGVIAKREEMDALLAAHPHASYLLFPEDRQFPIRMKRDLPLRWIVRGAGEAFHGVVRKGEFYVFQLGLFAARKSIEGVGVRWNDLKGDAGLHAIPARALRCFNVGGVDCAGKEFAKIVSIDSGTVQALWCGMQIPPQIPAGEYVGSVTVSATNAESTHIQIAVTVSDSTINVAGDDEPWRLSRLRWLDSKLASSDAVIPPYTPLAIEGNHVAILGRTLVIGANGLPSKITSYFTPEMTSIRHAGREILAAPLDLTLFSTGGSAVRFHYRPLRWIRRTAGRAVWEVKGITDDLEMDIHAEAEFDGCVEYTVALRARRRVQLGDVRLEIPIRADVAKYQMGLGLKGGTRPDTVQWKWNPKRNQDGAWVGDVNAGLQFTLKDEKYSRPLNTNFYQLKPLVMPTSWYNGGAGGIGMDATHPGVYTIGCTSGPRTMQEGEVQYYNFRLLITPFRTIDTDKQWAIRFYHRFAPVKEIAATGANTINVHHATAINPYINYPFFRSEEMKRYVDEAHASGMKVKIYYTVRELTNRAPELFALRSLGHEIFSPGPGGGFSWLQEQLGDDYIAAWFVPELKDAAIINSGVSRWHNFYVEGLHWLVKNVGIDGLYIDDVAFDRLTMKRIRRVLDEGGRTGLIDLHSANQYNERDGYTNSANLYLEHFPYIDRLWFGEYFDYDAPPDFWMVEMAGIPFGVMGEMLEKGGNPWRGMVYGMTNRLPWAGDPRPVWKVWDDFKIKGSQMIGYWVPSAPVKTDNDSILVTTYLKKGKALLALASWSKEPRRVRLTFDWKRLGIKPAKARLTALAAEGFQPAAEFGVNDPIEVAPGRGWLLILDSR